MENKSRVKNNIEFKTEYSRGHTGNLKRKEKSL